MTDESVEKKVSVDESPVAVKPRQREAWTSSEVKLIGRSVKAMARRRVRAALKCQDCKSDIVYAPNADGYDLLCDCKRRVFHRGI